MEFHHIGVATVSIKKSIEIFEKLGFLAHEVIFDEIQNVNICFLEKTDHPVIELIEPVNEKSPVHNILSKIGTTPYHFCYYTTDIFQEINDLQNNGFLLVIKPVEAVAFNNKKVCFCYNKDFGLMELVEK